MKAIHTVCYFILLAIGVIHLVFTFFIYDSLSLDALWFVGSGLAITFLGFMNFLFLKNRNSKEVYIVNQISNILLLLFVIFVDIVSPMVPGIVGLLVILALIGTSWKMYHSAKSSMGSGSFYSNS